MGTQNVRAEYFATLPPKKKPKTRYKKPLSVKMLEAELLRHKIANKPTIPPHYLTIKPLRDDTANGLTECICKWLTLHGYFAARVNTTGIYNVKLGRYVKGGSTRGMADITAVVNGRHVSIEVKVGKDKPRTEQLDVQKKVERAGGVYIFVYSFDDFLEKIKIL